MKAKDIKEVVYVEPEKGGVKGMYLAGLPEFVEGEKGNQWKARFVHRESNREFTINQFDPFTPSPNAKQASIEAGYLRLFRLAKAFMTAEKYNDFEELDLPDLKTAIQKMGEMFDRSWPDTPATLLIGYSKYNGYRSIPNFERYISTPFAEAELTLPTELSLTPVENPTKGNASAGSSPDRESSSADDEV